LTTSIGNVFTSLVELKGCYIISETATFN